MDAAIVVALGGHGRVCGRRVGRDVAVANAVAMVVAVVMAVPVALIDAMAVCVSVGVSALIAGDRDARLRRTATVETADASPATGRGARARHDQRGRGERHGSERATGGQSRLQTRTCFPCPGQSAWMRPQCDRRGSGRGGRCLYGRHRADN